MSPFLKENIPTATLDTQKTKASGPSAADKAKLDLVSKGWRLETFSSSAERLFEASSRLHKEATRESKYWDQVSQIKAEGWAVSRLPQEKHTLAVRFGFSEATPSFRNRGMAALRPRADGSLSLDIGATSSHHRAIQVSILEHNKQIGASTLPADTTDESEAIEQEVLQARNSLFEEELFYELNREARSMANLGVVSTHNLISIELPHQRHVQIRLVKLAGDPVNPSNSEPMGATAEMIAISLRLLLSRAHRKNFERRTKPPPPMTNRPRQAPEYALLRPVMALLQHREYFQTLDQWLTAQLKPLQVAGLPTSIECKALRNIDNSLGDISDKGNHIQWIESLIGTLESTVKIELPSTCSLEIKLRSLFGPPIWGTEFTISEISWEPSSTRLPPSRHATLNECIASLSQILLQDISVAIEAVSCSVDDVDEDRSAIVNSQHTHGKAWKSERPFSTVLTATGSQDSHLQFQLTPSAFVVRFSIPRSSNVPSGSSTQELVMNTYAWLEDGKVMAESGGERRDMEGTVALKQVLEESLRSF